MDSYSGVFFCDLDGTLAGKFGEISKKDLNSFEKLKKNNILRVIATGRSPYSAKKIIDRKFPIDYLICSTGSITMDWPQENILEKYNLTSEEVSFSADIFRSYKMDFMVLNEVPQNHKFDSFIFKRPHPDVVRRHKFYKGYYRVRDYDFPISRPSCQLIGIIDNNEDLLKEIISRFKGLKVIRSTSPLDGKSLWIEIYPAGVSKGNAITSLCGYLGVDMKNTGGIGNDFNDTEMLETVRHPFVVGNAPDILKKRFRTVSDCKNCGVSEAIDSFICSL
ncbi:MAG TPA: HAD hydrolase family protein [bacterium]|nr:HAD hydrolase family protein [bacterium]HPS30581.1 HAD hydrolase family protein [bacterium]